MKYSDLSLKAQMQEEVIKKLQRLLLSTGSGYKSYRCSQTLVLQLAVKVVCMSRIAYYYKPKLSDDSDIIDVLNKLTEITIVSDFQSALAHK